MTLVEAEALAALLRARVPGLAVRLHREPPAAARALPGWRPGVPWPVLVASAPGLRGLAVRSDGAWAVQGMTAFRHPPQGWDAELERVVAAMHGRRPPLRLGTLLRRLGRR